MDMDTGTVIRRIIRVMADIIRTVMVRSTTIKMKPPNYGLIGGGWLYEVDHFATICESVSPLYVQKRR